MRCFNALGLMVACVGFAHGAAAADYSAVPYAPPVGPAPIVELGTGWYLRGDIGLGTQTAAQLDLGSVEKASNKVGWSGGLGAGYKLNDYLRTDLTVDYFSPQHFSYTGTKTPNCPYGLVSVTDTLTQQLVGFSDSSFVGTCRLKGTSDLAQINALANAYVDLGTYFGVTPYIGAGVGAAQVKYSGYSDYYRTSDGTAYRADLTPDAGSQFPLTWVGSRPDNTYYYLNPQPKNARGAPLSFGPQDYSRAVSKTKYSVAIALMAGFSYAFTDHALVDVGYRYVNNGLTISIPGTNDAALKKDLQTHQVRVGFRYQID